MPSSEPARTDTGPPVGASQATGVPGGFSNDAEGARAAGLAFTRFASDLLAMSEPDALAARRAMAARSSAQAQAEEFAAQLSQLRKRWPAGSLRYQVTPLATRVETNDGFADVDVWYVGVVSARGIDTYAEWVTDSYQLVWEEGTWRIASLEETPGPTPAPGPQAVASPAEIEARLSGFEAIR